MEELKMEALLARLDERTINIWRAVADIQTHQIKQNGIMEDTAEKTSSNEAWRKALVWIVGAQWAVLGVIVAKLFAS